jgi:hypothetical protein
MNSSQKNEFLLALGLKPLNKIWAKIEIFLGLSCIFLGMMVGFFPVPNIRPFGSPEPSSPLVGFLTGLFLFVFGGYLALAGNRSHLYQSNNKLTAFLIEEIRKIQKKE